MLALLASRAGDTAALRALSMENAGRPDAPELLASFTRWRVAQALSWDKSRARLRTDLPRMTDASLRAIAMSSQYDGVGIDDGERALRLWRRRVVRGAEELDALLAEHSLAMNRGHPIVALDLTEQLEEVQPGSRAHLRLRVLDAIYGGGDSAAAASAIGKLERSLEGELAATEFERAARLADACVVAQWRLHRGAAGVAGLIAFLRQSGLPPATVPVGANPYTCATLLEASLAVSSRATDADAALARLDSLMLSGPAVSDASAYVHIWAARLWENRGRIEDALGAVRRRPYMAGWPRYLAATLREEGRLALLAGDTTGALKAFRQFLALRHSPDETLIPETDAVREITGQLSTRTGDAP
jgi:hypothetical protein